MSPSQLNLFGRRPTRTTETVRSRLLTNVRADDPAESRQAALANPEARQRHRDAILDALLRHPATRAELQDDLEPVVGLIDRSVISRRLTDLMQEGFVERTSQRRKTSAGASGAVFALSRRGEFALRGSPACATTGIGAGAGGSVSPPPGPAIAGNEGE